MCIFRACARSNSLPGWKLKKMPFLCTPVSTIDGTLLERAREVRRCGGHIDAILVVASPGCSNARFGGQRAAGAADGKSASFGRSRGLTASPVGTKDTFSCARPCVPEVGSLWSERAPSSGRLKLPEGLVTFGVVLCTTPNEWSDHSDRALDLCRSLIFVGLPDDPIAPGGRRHSAISIWSWECSGGRGRIPLSSSTLPL
eukprot:gene4757-biopygen11536